MRRGAIMRLPSTRNKKLARTVRQEINRAARELYRDHPDAQFAYEQLNGAGMKFKARRMNAYLYASNLVHIPAHLGWGAAKRGIRARTVTSAYSHERLQLTRVPALSSGGPRESPKPTDVLVWGLRAYESCRRERSRESGKSSGRSRASRLRRPPGHQSALGEATPGLAKYPKVGRSPTCRRVVSSTGVALTGDTFANVSLNYC